MPTTPAAPSGKSTAVVEIERLGMKYQEIAQYDLDLLSPDRRVQVREGRNYAKPDRVERYAIQMELVAFPPIIVTADAWIVDGNTRVGAALRRKQHRFPALVLDRTYDGADPLRQIELHALATTLNQQGGESLTKAEIRTEIARMVPLGWTTQQMGRATGQRPAVISGVKKELEARAKLERVGIHPNGELKGTSLRALGGPLVVELNDEPFEKLARLAIDAGLNAGEIFAAAKEVKATGSDVAGVTRVQQLRAEQEERIQQRAMTGTGKPPVARQLRQHLGFIVRFVGQEQQLIERHPTVSAGHLEAINTSIRVLQAIALAQRALPTGGA